MIHLKINSRKNTPSYLPPRLTENSSSKPQTLPKHGSHRGGEIPWPDLQSVKSTRVREKSTSYPFPRWLNHRTDRWPVSSFSSTSPSPIPIIPAYIPTTEWSQPGSDDGWISLEARAVDTILHFAWVLENHVHAELSQKTDSDDSRILIQSAPSPTPILCVPTTNIPPDLPVMLPVC